MALCVADNIATQRQSFEKINYTIFQVEKLE